MNMSAKRDAIIDKWLMDEGITLESAVDKRVKFLQALNLHGFKIIDSKDIVVQLQQIYEVVWAQVSPEQRVIFEQLRLIRAFQEQYDLTLAVEKDAPKPYDPQQPFQHRDAKLRGDQHVTLSSSPASGSSGAGQSG